MSDPDDLPNASSEAGIAAAFFCALYEDRLAGRVRTLEEYQARFAGFEDLLAREYASFLEEEAESSTSARVNGSPPGDRASSANDAPRLLGRYQLLRSLGRGGQGEVWLAEDPRLKRKVALKILHSWSAASPQAFARFRREAEIASRLEHPGICTVYESGMEQGLPYFAMRYVEGESLAQRIAMHRSRLREQGVNIVTSTPTTKAELALVLQSIEQAARAVHVAHEAGVVHRDLKPANIVVTANGQPVLLDFGLARDLESDAATLTHTGEIFGTPDYMAPEQVTGRLAEIDARTDVYALGVTLYECLTLRRPFAGATRDALYHSILHAHTPRLRRILPHASKDLEVIVQTALEKVPAQRYHSALELAEDLRRLRCGEPIRARRVGPLRRLTRWMRREPLVATLLAGVLTTVAIGGYLLSDWLAFRGELATARAAEESAAVERLLEEGFLALGEDDDPRAAALFAQVLQHNQQQHEAVIGLVLMHCASRDFVAARGILEEHRHLFPDHPELAWAEAELRQQEGRGDASIEGAVPLAAKQSALTHFLRGFREILNGHDGDKSAFSRAEAHLQSCVLASNVARPLYHHQFAHAVGHGDDEALRRRTAETLLALWPESGMAWYWAGFLHASIDWPRAAIYYEEAVRLRPFDERAHTNLGNAYHSLGRHEDAAQAHRRALEIEPRYAHAWYNLGNVENSLQHVEAAEACYKQLLEIDPTFRSGNSKLFSIYYRRQEYDRAAEAIAREVEHHPDRDDAWGNWGQALRHAHRIDEAIRVLEEALRLHPKSAICWRYLGFARADQNDKQGALQAYENAIASDPEEVISLRQAADVLEDLKRYDEAWTYIQRATELDLLSRGGWSLRSRIEMHLGQLELALDSIRKAAVIGPEEEVVRQHIAYYLQLLDRPAENAVVLSGLVERNPTDYIRRCMLGQALLYLGRIEAALAELRQGGAAARDAKDTSFTWQAWLEQAEAEELQRQRDITAIAGGAALPDDPRRLLIVAESAAHHGDMALALRAYEAHFASAEKEQRTLPLGLRIRAARCAAATDDPRVLEWMAADLQLLRERGEVAEAFDLEQLARSWRHDPALKAWFALPVAERVREQLDRWLAH